MMAYTIGEVLNRLRDEFVDVTISRIRQFESRGLISPDRTESGYRKFTERDIDRVRYVLTALRDRHISLDVIGRELDRIDQGLSPRTSESDDVPKGTADHRSPHTDDPDHHPGPATDDVKSSPPGPLQLRLDGSGSSADDVPEPARHSIGNRTESALSGEQGSSPPSPDHHTPAADPGQSATRETGVGPFVDEVGDLRLTDSELADEAGLTIDDVKQLREHGILGREALFDAKDVTIARIAAQLLAAGLEPRHLRMYRQFAQREAGLLEQLMLPHLRQRNPDSRDRALAMSQRLGELGTELQQRLRDEELDTVLRAWR